MKSQVTARTRDKHELCSITQSVCRWNV